MTETFDMPNLYLQYGAAGLCTIMFVWMNIYFITNIGPRLRKLEENSLVVTEILRQSNEVQSKSNGIIEKTQDVLRENQKVVENNTQAFLNFSETIQNLTGFMNTQDSELKEIKSNVSDLSKDIVRLTERVGK